MSGLPLGAPVRRGPTHTSTTRVFGHIPRLREVLAHGGWPGAVYAQVCIHNLKAARERTDPPAKLDELQGGSVYYTVAGPKGRAEVALVGTGEVIPGASPESGNRLFFTDGEIGMATGLHVQYPIWLRQPPDEESDESEVEITQAAGRTGQGRKSHAGVPKRHAPQRQQVRPAGDEPQAGGGDRPVRGKTISPQELARRKASSERFKAMHAARREART